MAKYSIGSGGKGRPLSIDPQRELNELTFNLIPKAQKNLARFRKETSGVRGAQALGSDTLLPAFLQSSKDILVDLTEGAYIDYDTLRMLKENLTNARLLASRQYRAYGRALEGYYTREYFQALDYSTRNAGELIKRSNEKIKEQLSSLTPQQRQKYFLSRQYQDPKTMTGEYKSLVAWASKEVGREVSVQEAWAIKRESDLGIFLCNDLSKEDYF